MSPLCVGLLYGDLCPQRFQSALPEGPVALKPIVNLNQRGGTQAINSSLRFVANIDEPSLAQYAQMPRDTRSGDRKRAGEFAGRGRVVAEDVKHRPAAAVRESLQDCVHLRLVYQIGYVTVRLLRPLGSSGSTAAVVTIACRSRGHSLES